jgi:hypothetical protein
MLSKSGVCAGTISLVTSPDKQTPFRILKEQGTTMVERDYNHVPAGESHDERQESNGRVVTSLEVPTESTESKQALVKRQQGRADERITVDEAIGVYGCS